MQQIKVSGFAELEVNGTYTSTITRDGHSHYEKDGDPRYIISYYNKNGPNSCEPSYYIVKIFKIGYSAPIYVPMYKTTKIDLTTATWDNLKTNVVEKEEVAKNAEIDILSSSSSFSSSSSSSYGATPSPSDGIGIMEIGSTFIIGIDSSSSSSNP